jgi:hypothetical protein
VNDEQTPAAADAPPEPKALFYVLSFFVPVAGIVLGAIYLGKPDKDNKEFGKMCLTWAVINFALGFTAACCLLGAYVSFIIAYLVFIVIIIGAVGLGAATSSLAGVS